jgi:hypothetical protein
MELQIEVDRQGEYVLEKRNGNYYVPAVRIKRLEAGADFWSEWRKAHYRRCHLNMLLGIHHRYYQLGMLIIGLLSAIILALLGFGMEIIIVPILYALYGPTTIEFCFVGRAKSYEVEKRNELLRELGEVTTYERNSTSVSVGTLEEEPTKILLLKKE